MFIDIFINYVSYNKVEQMLKKCLQILLIKVTPNSWCFDFWYSNDSEGNSWLSV